MAIPQKPKAEKQTFFTVKDYLASKNGAKHDVLPENRSKRKKPAPVPAKDED